MMADADVLSVDNSASAATPKQPRSSRATWGLGFCMPGPREKSENPKKHNTSSKRSLKGTFYRIFGVKPRARPQPQSSFFSLLPLEIRHEIYTYIFASSFVHERTKDLLSDWDYLLMLCRQAKQEMVSMPVQPIIAMVQAHWLNQFPAHPLHVSTIFNEDRLQDLIIAVPRAVFQPHYRRMIQRYIPEYISPLFRIFTDTLTLRILDDGSPLVDIRRVHVHHLIFSQILSLVWAREPKLLLLGKKYIKNPLDLPSTRNYFNAKKVVVDWQGALSNMYEEKVSLFYWLHLQWFLSKPFRMRLHLGKRRFVLDWIDKKRFTIQAVSWESKTRFRRWAP